MSLFEDSTTTIIIVLAVTLAVTAAISVFFGMRLRSKKKPVSDEKGKNKNNRNFKNSVSLEEPILPFMVSKSIQTTTATNAKDELRILDLEREILGDSIRRLYEAQAEGKITESERDKLAVTYKNRMNVIRESIAKDETIVALHELEGMQEDLMQLFSERFGELTSKVEELRGRIDIKPIKEISIKLPPPIPIQMEQYDEEEEEEEPSAPASSRSSGNSSSGEERPKKKRKPPTEKLDVKSEAEKRIESIRSDVEKVLDKLGQMEIEN